MILMDGSCSRYRLSRPKMRTASGSRLGPAESEPRSRSTNDSGSARATPGILLISRVSSSRLSGSEVFALTGIPISRLEKLALGPKEGTDSTAESATTSYPSVTLDLAGTVPRLRPSLASP